MQGWGKFKRSVTEKRKKSGHQNRSKLRIPLGLVQRGTNSK